jgi:hypothetical protein
MSIIGRVGIRGKIALSVALCSLVWIAAVLVLHGDMRSDPEFALPMDHHKYIAMAQQDLGSFRIAPFCWRIGMPSLARMVGGDPWTVMAVLTSIGLICMMCAVALLVWDATASKRHVLGVCATALAMGWLTRTSVWNPATVDMLACGLMMISVYLLTRRVWVWSAIVLCGAVLVKESALLALPIALVVSSQRPWKHLAMWTLPAVVVVAIVRLSIPAGNADASYVATLPEALRLVQHGTSTYSLSYLVSTIALDRLLHPSLTDMWALTGDSVGLVAGSMLIAVAWYVPSRRWFMVVLCAVTAAQVLLAVNIQRVVLMSGPALAAIGWMYIDTTRLRWASVLLVYLACGLLVVTTVGSRVSPSILMQVAALVVFIGAYLYQHRRELEG